MSLSSIIGRVFESRSERAYREGVETGTKQIRSAFHRAEGQRMEAQRLKRFEEEMESMRGPQADTFVSNEKPFEVKLQELTARISSGAPTLDDLAVFKAVNNSLSPQEREVMLKTEQVVYDHNGIYSARDFATSKKLISGEDVSLEEYTNLLKTKILVARRYNQAGMEHLIMSNLSEDERTICVNAASKIQQSLMEVLAK